MDSELLFEIDHRLLAVTVVRHLDSITGEPTIRAYLTLWLGDTNYSYSARELREVAQVIGQAVERLDNMEVQGRQPNSVE